MSAWGHFLVALWWLGLGAVAVILLAAAAILGWVGASEGHAGALLSSVVLAVVGGATAWMLWSML